MRLGRGRHDRAGLMHFGEQFAYPELAVRTWLHNKKQGKTEIPKHKANVQQVLPQFQYNKAVLGILTDPHIKYK